VHPLICIRTYIVFNYLLAHIIQLELREYDSDSTSRNDEEKKEPPGDEDGMGGGYGGGGGGMSGSGGGDALVGGGGGTCKEASEMRGVHARTHIPPNTVCMSVPRRCLITVEMGQATPIGQAILHSELDLDAPKHIFLMVYVLWDRKVNGANSFFHPYYEILPPTLRNMPIFWSDEELSNLEGSYLLQQIQDRNQAITEDYYAICQICPMLRQIATLDEFKWARMCVCSRNFGLQMDGHRTSALVPHADMLNHYRPRETKWTFDEERNAFTITSLQHIPAGAQVYDSYGQKCNHRFLLNYGFAVEDNRELDGFCPNEVPIELYVDADDELFTEKLEYWTRGETHHGASGTTASTLRNSPTTANDRGSSPSPVSSPVVKRVRVCISNNENTRLLFSLLRALACNREELAAIGGIMTTTTGTAMSSMEHHIQQFLTAPSTTASTRNHGNDNSCSASAMSVGGRGGGGSTRGAAGANSDSGGMARGLLGFPSNLTTSMMQQQRQQQQQQQHLYSPNADIPSFSIRPVGGGTAGLPSALAAAAAATTASSSYQRSCRDIRHPISLRNERAAMRLLLEVVGRHLSQYPTSLAHDVADLLDENTFPRFSNKRHAKIQVRGEKEVLHHYALWARTSLDVLDVIEGELKEERGSVEVQLTPQGQTTVTAVTPQEERLGFEYVIRRMEDDADSGTHHTIVRYCADVLGSLRREEFKNIRRQRSNEAKARSSNGGGADGDGSGMSTGYL